MKLLGDRVDKGHDGIADRKSRSMIGFVDFEMSRQAYFQCRQAGEGSESAG